MIKFAIFAVLAACLIGVISFFPKQASTFRNQAASGISTFTQGAAREASKDWDVIAGHSTTETTTPDTNFAPEVASSAETLDQMFSPAKPSPSVDSEYQKNVKSGKWLAFKNGE